MLSGAVNKFVVAGIGLAIILANQWLNTSVTIPPEIVTSIAAPITAWLVYQIPNKGA